MQLAERLDARCRLTVLTHLQNCEVAEGLPYSVSHVIAPVRRHWFARAAWSSLRMQALCTSLDVDAVFNPSGMLTVGFRGPQVVLAQNPLPLMNSSRGIESLKLRLQKSQFARAQSRAALMVFNSAYMSSLYGRAFGPATERSIVAYQGIDGRHFREREQILPRLERTRAVLAVSVMASHKSIEDLVDAFALGAAGIAGARLVLAGGWPDSRYRGLIESRIRERDIESRVDVLGHVDDAQLDQLYSEAAVFCLLSRCESFGIPAVEAQAHGTPCVVADGTAAPEIVGKGGVVVSAGDAASAGAALNRLLNDHAHWAEVSANAHRNAERFRWRTCSQPLVEALSRMEKAIPPLLSSNP